jgi:2-polyprenyl-3-methyl-5-hydroxy-6-metoxy-1,4-benzoquinol methylase
VSSQVAQDGLRARFRQQTQRQHFGYFADRYEPSLFWKVMTWPLVRIFKSNLLPPLPPAQPGRHLLEIGCAHGERLHYLRTLGWNVQGVEFSDMAASRAREKGLPCITSSIEDCSWPEGSFDVIIMSMVLEHLSDPLSILRRVNRLLKPGGRLLLSVPNINGIEARLFGSYAYTLQVPTHLAHFTPKTLSRMLSEAGFDDLEVTYQGFHRDLKSGLEHYVQDHPHKAWMLKVPGGVFKFGGLLLGLLRMSSRISVSVVRRDRPLAIREA